MTSASVLRVGALLCAATVGVFAITAPQPAEAQTIRWRLQTVDPPNFVGPAVALPEFIKSVDSATKGRLKIQMFTAGQLVPTGQILNALQNKTIDIAFTNPVYYTGQIPESLLAPAALPPMIFPSKDVAQEIYWNRGVDDLIREGYKPNGVHYLGTLFYGDPITFWSRKRLSGIKDLKGFKLRTFGYNNQIFEKFGALPVSIPHEEVYSALASGAIDGSMTAATYYGRAKYYEHAPFFYSDSWNNALSMSLMVSRASWEALPDDLRPIVEAEFRKFADRFYKLTKDEYAAMLETFPKNKVTQVKWSEEDLKATRSLSISYLPEIERKSERVGKGVDIIRRHLKEVGAPLE